MGRVLHLVRNFGNAAEEPAARLGGQTVVLLVGLEVSEANQVAKLSSGVRLTGLAQFGIKSIRFDVLRDEPEQEDGDKRR